MFKHFTRSKFANLYASSKWVRYGFHVIGGTLFLPTYCFFASCLSAWIVPYHLDIGQWMRQNLPTMVLCGLFVFGVSGFFVWNRPWHRLTRWQSVVIAALLVTTPVLTTFLR